MTGFYNLFIFLKALDKTIKVATGEKVLLLFESYLKDRKQKVGL